MANTYDERPMDANVTYKKWEKKKQQMEDADEAAHKGLKEALKAAHRNQETRDNLCRETIRARRGDTAPIRHREGFAGGDDDLETGFERPWERN